MAPFSCLFMSGKKFKMLQGLKNDSNFSQFPEQGKSPRFATHSWFFCKHNKRELNDCFTRDFFLFGKKYTVKHEKRVIRADKRGPFAKDKVFKITKSSRDIFFHG